MPEEKINDEITPMQQHQAYLDHIAARGHSAMRVPSRKRTPQQREDVRIFRQVFGDDANVDSKPPKRSKTLAEKY